MESGGRDGEREAVMALLLYTGSLLVSIWSFWYLGEPELFSMLCLAYLMRLEARWRERP